VPWDVACDGNWLSVEESTLTAEEKSAEGIVCAGQRTDWEGSSPSGARMRGAISKSGGNASLAGNEPEGRVSTVRWNPKGMRRTAGP